MLGDGKVEEYDAPQKLLEDENSHFTKLVEEMKNSGDAAKEA